MTVLIIGGAHQGKAEFAAAQYPALPLVNALHMLVRETMEAGGDPQALLPALLGRAVTCDEIGCGIVPINPFEERWREETGRLCCALAARADAVYRIWAGIPQRIK